jgi:hypothetical protein
LVINRLPKKLFLVALALAGITDTVNLFIGSAIATEYYTFGSVKKSAAFLFLW